jgi:hypothetical protein
MLWLVTPSTDGHLAHSPLCGDREVGVDERETLVADHDAG